MSPTTRDDREPSPEHLAAYADGELDGDPRLSALRDQVEAWLADHPAARAEVESQRRLTRLWQETRPEAPAEGAWERVLPAVRQRVLAGGRSRGPRWWPFAWVVGALATGAAAAAITVAFLRAPPPAEVARPDPPWQQPRPPDGPGPAPRPGSAEPFPVATADEVEILSVRGPEMARLLVGRRPVEGPLELVAHGEVEVERAEPDFQMGDGATPMLWARVGREVEEP
jgi:hypothetical protein